MDDYRSIIGPTGGQYTDFERVQSIMSSLKPPKAGNPRILVIDQAPLIKAKNGGYPIWLYHHTLEAQYVTREDQQLELEKMGYTTTYIPHLYPRTMFRRNMDPKYDAKLDVPTGLYQGNAFVEERIVKDEAHEKRLLGEKYHGKYKVGPWVYRLTDIEPLNEGPGEDPAVTIARLEGQLAGHKDVMVNEPRQGKPEPHQGKRRGRPPKKQPNDPNTGPTLPPPVDEN
jgi:hypothetical protein